MKELKRTRENEDLVEKVIGTIFIHVESGFKSFVVKDKKFLRMEVGANGGWKMKACVL